VDLHPKAGGLVDRAAWRHPTQRSRQQQAFAPTIARLAFGLRVLIVVQLIVMQPSDGAHPEHLLPIGAVCRCTEFADEDTIVGRHEKA
jgi:hypothetical protein